MLSQYYYAFLVVPTFFCAGFCHEESHWQPAYDYYHIDLGDLGGHHGHGDLEVKTPLPRDVMVDVINELGVKLLAIHNEHNENNIGISPYGALSVLAALTEGIQGDAASEIVYAAHIPKDKHIMRVGLRDIHRHLKSYFIPPEGFLAGLTLNLNNVTLRSEYEDVLRFYGFDYGSFNNALYPGPSTTPAPSAENTTTLGTTLGVSEGVTQLSVGETTTVKAVNRLGSPMRTTPSEQTTTTTVATTTENLARTTPETTAKLTEAPSELTTKLSEETTTKTSLEVTMSTTPTPTTLIATEGTTQSTIITIGDSAPQESTILTTTQNILPASTTTTPAVTTATEANTVTTTVLPETTTTGTEAITDTTVKEATSEISSSTVKTNLPTEKVGETTETEVSTVVSTTSIPTTTTRTTVTDILTTITEPPSTTASLPTTTTVPMTAKEEIMTTLEPVTSTKETTQVTTEMQTTLPSTEVTNKETVTTVTVPTTEEVKTDITEASTMTTAPEVNPETTPPPELLQQLQDLQTTTPFFIGTTPEFQDMGDFDQNNFDFNYNYDANAQFNGTGAQGTPLYDDANAALPNTNNFPNTPEGFNRNFRRVRSVADYVFARYYEHNSHYIPPHKRPYRPYYRPEEPLTFAAYGKYQEPGVNFMKYDTVLPFYFVPNLNALALSFPLDNTKYYLLLLLPVDFNGVDQLICDLRLHGNLRFILENLRLTHVIATIPSFTLKGYVTLTPTLQQLGIRRIFEPRQADFSPMTNVTDIYVTNIEQAVTVTIRNYLDPSAENYKNLRRYPPVQFRADHPFLYFVMDTELNVALMVGKVVNPLNSRIR